MKNKLIDKWNYEKHEYEPYYVPSDWNVKTYSTDMKERINCPHCGKEIAVGDSYTSLELHTEIGFGYMVCNNCYALEWGRRRNARE